MYYNPGQIVNNLVYLNSDLSANLETYMDPALPVGTSYTNNPPARTKS